MGVQVLQITVCNICKKVNHPFYIFEEPNSKSKLFHFYLEIYVVLTCSAQSTQPLLINDYACILSLDKVKQ